VSAETPLTAVADRNREPLDPKLCGILFMDNGGMQCPRPALARHTGGCKHEHMLDAPIPLCDVHEALIGTVTVNCKQCRNQRFRAHNCPVVFAIREPIDG
jgi:hypothetical protein